MTLKVTEQCRDLNQLHAASALACRALFYECLARGLNVFVTETYRSPARQAYLYQQGRTRPGDVITWTLNSNHSSRLAFDLAVCAPANLYDTATLEAVGKVARELGITWGGDWRPTIDRPHFEVKPTWQLPAKYNREVINGVIVPSNVYGRVQLTVVDDPYKDKIGYNIAPNATRYRLLSGPLSFIAEAEARRELLDGAYLQYAEPAGPIDGQWRVQSGAYTTLEAAEQAARKIVRDGQLRYVTINGTLK